MISVQKIISLILYKQSNLIVSLDYENFDDLVLAIELIKDKVLGIKIHSDIIKNFQPTFLNKIKGNLLIIDDRKFCDIGMISALQSEEITKYSDLITCHGLPGQGIIDGLMYNCITNNCGILLIAQMSSHDNLITSDYTNKVIEMANTESNKNIVMGFICQEKLVGNLLHFSPGVNLDVTSDELGQFYNTPSNLIKNGIDVLIVGRGITKKLLSQTNIDILLEQYTELNYDNLRAHFSNKLMIDLQAKGLVLVSDEEYTLSSGIKSNTYYNIKNIISYPKILSNITLYMSTILSQLCLNKFNNKNYNTCDIVLAGIPYGGIPIATSLSLHTFIPSIILREKQKTHGLFNKIDGNCINKNIIIIEDVITTGKSIINFCKLLKDSETDDIKYNVIAALSVINRGNIHYIPTQYGKLDVMSILYV